MVDYSGASTLVVFSDASQGSLFRSVCLPLRGRVGGAFPYYAVFGFSLKPTFPFSGDKVDPEQEKRLPWLFCEEASQFHLVLVIYLSASLKAIQLTCKTTGNE